METTDSAAKQAALDNKSAHAGMPTPTPDMGIDQMGTDAGLGIEPEAPLAVKEALEKRDDNRFDVPPKSKEVQR
ncbi:MAG: DUF6335 family protein [Cyanobacteria bacterium J06627_28]